MRLFKSQKTSGDRAKLFINLNSAQKTPIPILASDQKYIFCKQVLFTYCWKKNS